MSSRKLTTSVSNIRLIAIREHINEFVSMSHLCGTPYSLLRSVLNPKSYVVKDRSIEKNGILVYIPHQMSEVLYSDVPYINAINRDAPLHYIVEAWDEINKRGFTRSRVANKSHCLSLANLEVYISQDPLLSIAERDMV